MTRTEKPASRVLSITMGLLLLSSAAGQEDLGADQREESTIRQTLIGRVLLPDRAPAAAAVVVTSCGGQVATSQDGSFALAVHVPRDAQSLQMIAAAGSNLVASAQVVVSPQPVIDVGTLVLAAATSCQPSWLPTFGEQPGPQGAVLAFTAFDDGSGPALYAGGNFVSIAKWNGSRWSVLGSGVNGRVFALAVFDYGSGPALYAGGSFVSAGGVIANSIAKWDGASWSALGNGMADQAVFALTVFDDGSGPALYAGGRFTTIGGVAANHIAKWNGSGWSALGIGAFGGGPNQGVNALTVFDDGSGPALYVGGSFAFAGTVFGAATNIAKWNGSSWSALGSGVGQAGTGVPEDSVEFLTAFDDGSGPALYATGSFTIAGGVAANNIAKWQGWSWSALGSGLTTPPTGVPLLIAGFAGFDDGGGPGLYVTGTFTRAGGVPVNGFAKWNGATWSAFGSGIASPLAQVQSLTVFDDGGGPTLHASGYLPSAIGARFYVARWRGGGWSALGSGLNAVASALAFFDDGSASSLYAGGSFTAAGIVAMKYIAKWNGSSWSALGSDMNQPVRVLTVFDDGGGGSLYAGGDFTTAGGSAANHIAKWNGTRWQALGSGLSSSPLALASFDDGSGKALYAGGAFTSAGGVAVNRIAKWNGTSWSPLGSGFSGASPQVLALEVFDDGTGPALYAAGTFEFAGGVAAIDIAKWNGTSWSPVGLGISGWVGMQAGVSALKVFDDGTGPALYVGGHFPAASGIPAPYIAKWDGATWTSVGSGMNDDVRALAVFDDGGGPALYAAGLFTLAGLVPANNIAKWDGASWSALGVGLPGVNALTAFDDGSGAALYAGGWFPTSPGGDSYIAKWGCQLPPGARTYGVSSPGCNGPLAIGANSSPHLGNAAFAITCSNAPPSAGGALLLGFPLMASLPFQGAQVWVNPIFAPLITSSALGVGQIALPIPADPVFAGVWFGLQFFWIGPNAPPPCPPRAVSASNGLVVTIQP